MRTCRARALRHGVRREQEREHEHGDDDQFEEAVPCVLGVRQADLRLDQIAAAEEETQLHENECQEEKVDSAERHGQLGGSEPRRRNAWRHETLVLTRREKIAQQAGRHPGDADDDDECSHQRCGTPGTADESKLLNTASAATNRAPKSRSSGTPIAKPRATADTRWRLKPRPSSRHGTSRCIN